MPPKKKQEQIDLSTLPECKTFNIFLLCKGKHDRANKILSKIDAKLEKMGNHVKKSAVLDFAKEKNIYVDPDSLTDKQKKDPKFMETVCTVMTPQVLAKATDAYISNLNVKIRLEKKALLDKPETAEGEKNKKIDCLYIFDDFPVESTDFQALSAANQGIRFVLVINPKISWASAPEEPQPVADDEEPQQPDEQYTAYLKLKEAENLTPEDKNHENQVQHKLQLFRTARRNTERSSSLRDTIIEEIKCNIDPYTEEASIEELVATLLPTCERLLLSFEQFKNWGKERTTEKLPEITQKLSLQSKDGKSSKNKGDNTMSIINKILKTFSSDKKDDSKSEEIDFSNFDFSNITQPPVSMPSAKKMAISENILNQYLCYNEQQDKQCRDYSKQVLTNLRYPGIDRYLMPQVPTKSQGVRKNYRSYFSQFLPKTLSFQDFQQKCSILYLQSICKQNDEQRTYNFSTKIYQQQHTKQSLQRQLSKCLAFDQSLPIIKYNQNNDKLYVCLLYKNPVRRMFSKIWDSNWKVLPNFENWMKFFKENQSNLGNLGFYDIDYERIGQLQEDANVWVLDAGVIVRKKATVGGKTNCLLYGITGNNTGDLIFGIRNCNNQPEFYAKNETASLIQTTINKQISGKQEKQKSILLTFTDGTTIEFRESGDILTRKPMSTSRLVTRDGYTILYQSDRKRIILHPDGSISQPPHKFVNSLGKGLNNGQLYQVPALRRTIQSGQAILKRDDNTVLVRENDKKWIKFQDSTQYLHNKEGLIIEKEGYPTFRVKNGTITMDYNGVHVESQSVQGGFQYHFTFTRLTVNNQSRVVFTPSHIQIFDWKSETPYICDLSNSTISKQWNQEKLVVGLTSSKYHRNKKQIVDPEQDEENYNEGDVLKPDYLQPRVFVINNDNTGSQFLSFKQLQADYLCSFTNNPKPDIVRSQLRQEKHPNYQNKSVIHGVIPIPASKELNKKNIQEIKINLDVFDNAGENTGGSATGTQFSISKSQPAANAVNESAVDDNLTQNIKERMFQVRSIIKHEPLTKEDRETIAQILKKRAEHQAKSDRDDNEYGFKPRNDPSTLERFESKKMVIQYRKMKEQAVLSQLLKEEAILLYEKETQVRLKKIENDRLQMELQKRLSRKKSYAPQYIWKEPGEVDRDENIQFYNQQRSFYTNYFETAQGKKALSQMPDWVFRPKQNKKPQQLDPQIRSQLNATLNKTKKDEQMNATNQKVSYKQQSQQNQRYDTVQPELRPSPIIYIKPSVFTQREIDDERYAFETEKKSYQYHEKKRKDFDVYGKDRKERVQVPSLMRTQPVSELNQKYLVTEAPVDKKVKISSMKNKLTSQASNMTEMRKEGPHANLIRTIDKANSYSKLLEKRTMMVQADLNDRLQRDIQINPIEANFGVVKEGASYELKIQIKNEDVLAQRIQLKKPKSIFCRVQMPEMGPIALGMTRKISVILKAGSEINGKFTDQFDIVTKHEIYHIPISAQVVSKTQFDQNGLLLSKTIREVEEISKKKREQLPPIKQ